MDVGIENYLIPCVNKKLFGIECLGCGMQRAAVLFFKGEWMAAFHMYPAIYTIVLLLAVVVINLIFPFKQARKIKFILIYVNVAIIVLSYFLKLYNYIPLAAT